MKIILLFVLASVSVFATQHCYCQSDTYFPPLSGDGWETMDPSELGWCSDKIDSLYGYLDGSNSKAFIALKDGKIVLERYFDEFTADSVWYWASAGKTITATLIGIAQEESLLDINDPVSDYLGEGWTICETAEEAERTIFHQLTMSSGFSTSLWLSDCTEPECFDCAVPPGSQWHYQNGVYRRLIEVVEAASGLTRNQYTTQKIKNKIGMGGFWFDNLYVSTARDMARFGLLVSNDYNWDGEVILGDMEFIEASRNSALEVNPSYGYLWWLNGKEHHYLPLDPIEKPGFLVPSAPADMYAAMGANDQRVYVVPSQNLVVIRMGEEADEMALAASEFDAILWQYMSDLSCESLATIDVSQKETLLVFPNPAYGQFTIKNASQFASARILNARGSSVWEGQGQSVNDVIKLSPGFYIVEARKADGSSQKGKIVVY